MTWADQVGQCLEPTLTEDEAREITQGIKNAAETTWALLLTAYERDAPKAMGYPSWETYCATEFDMSRAHGYRLLDHGRVMRALEAATVSPIGDIPEGATRGLKPEDVPAVAVEVARW